MSGPSIALLPDRAARGLAPELLEPVELARVRREDVDDDVEVVHQDPARLREALDAARQQAVLLLEALMDAVVDGLRLAVGVARADDEEVRVAEHAAEVELGDVYRLLVGREVRDLAREGSGVDARLLREGSGLCHAGAVKDRPVPGDRAARARCRPRPRRPRGSAPEGPPPRAGGSASWRCRSAACRRNTAARGPPRGRPAAPRRPHAAPPRAPPRRAARARARPRDRAKPAASGPCRRRR